MPDDPKNPNTAERGPSRSHVGEQADSLPAEASSPRRFGLGQAVLYPKVYVWYIFLAALDIMFTYLIIHPDLFVKGFDPDKKDDLLGLEPRGAEVNPLADWIIQRWGIPGMALFKLSIVLLVIGICEIVGRRKHRVGRTLAMWAVVLSAIPVVVAAWYLIREVTSYA